MDKREIVKMIHEYIDQRVSGIGGNPHQTEYKRDFLRIFKAAKENNIELHGDGIVDFVTERWPDKMKQSKYREMLIDMMRSWREWEFFLAQYNNL